MKNSLRPNNEQNFDFRIFKFFHQVLKALILIVFLLHKGRPDSPQKSEVNCDVISAQVQWLSSFDGGDNQQFIVLAYIGDEEASRSEPVFDVGENIIHKTSIHLLQPSTDYFFYVFAKNKHGNTSSEVMSCKTLAEGMLVFYVHLKYAIFV